MFGNNWSYVSIHGGALSLFVEFSRSKTNKFVKLHTLKKINRKIYKIEKLREKNVENMERKKSSPIRMTLMLISSIATAKKHL